MKDLNKFIAEKAANASKRPLDKDTGADDKEYVQMMERYKRMRRDPSRKKEARNLLKDTIELGRNGDVSEKAKIAGAYI